MERKTMIFSALIFAVATGAAAAVATSNAVLTAVLAMAFLKEYLSYQQWAGIGAVILGIVLLRI